MGLARNSSAEHARLEVIVGPMYSGKSAELVRRVHLAEIARLQVRVFRPSTDTRVAEEVILSRNGTRVAARLAADALEMMRHLLPSTEVVAVDEAQFFGEDLVELVQALLRTGRRVIVAGLDLDFAARPFGPMPTLLALADTVDKLTAVCMACHSLYATRTQRLVNGEPASEESPQIVIDAGERAVEVRYEARCLACYRPPRSTFAQLSYYAGDASSSGSGAAADSVEALRRIGPTPPGGRALPSSAALRTHGR